MTASSSTGQPARFLPLEQADFQRLEHAGYLKGLLQPFKGKGSLEAWANQCTALRDGLIGLAHRRVLQQARAYPFSRKKRAIGKMLDSFIPRLTTMLTLIGSNPTLAAVSIPSITFATGKSASFNALKVSSSSESKLTVTRFKPAFFNA